MDSLIKAADDFEQKTSEETFDEKTFVEFMKKVAIWEYYGITKQAYLAMSEQEKEIRSLSIILTWYLDKVLVSCFIFYLFEDVSP